MKKLKSYLRVVLFIMLSPIILLAKVIFEGYKLWIMKMYIRSGEPSIENSKDKAYHRNPESQQADV